MIKKTLRNLLAMLISCFSIFNKIIKKNNNKILLYSNTGYKDNLSAIHKYLLENGFDNRYKILFSINNHKIYNNKMYISNIGGFFHFFTAKYVFYYNGKIPIKPSKNQVVVNLWHGIPLKKIGRLTQPKVFIDYSTYYVVSSKKVGEIFTRCFGCDTTKLLYCGSPRNDYLFTKQKLDEDIKTIFWLPTFKSSDIHNIIDSDLSNKSITGLPIFHTKEQLDILNDKLITKNINIVIKLHPMEKNKTLLKYSFSNISVINDEYLVKNNIELYSILANATALITDYSSIYFDFLLLNRPIAFMLEDYKSYEENRGFTVDNPLDILAGDKIYTTDEFMSFIENIALGKDNYSKKRQEIKKEYHNDFPYNYRKLLLEKLDIK